MRTLAIAIVGLSLSALATAQSLALSSTPNNNGNVGGGIYFNLTVNQTLTITSIDYHCKNDGAAGPYMSSFDMFVGPSTYVGNVTVNPGPWVHVASTTPVSITGGTGVNGSGPSQIVNGVLNPAGLNTGTVTLIPGTYGIALRAVNHSWRYFGAGTAATYQTSTNADMSAYAGGASNGFLAAPTFAPRAICGTINYTIGGTPMQFAQREPYGNGCYLYTRSFYEHWPSSTTLDVANTSMYLAYDSGTNRYSAIIGGTNPPIAVTSTPLGHTDDNNLVVTLANSQPILYPAVGGTGAALTVEMSANGYLNLNGTNPLTANPSVAAFLAGTPRIGMWHDFDPSGLSYTPAATGASTHYDYDATNASHVFTWFNCPDSYRNVGNSANRGTFQMACFANGDVEFRWAALVLGGGQWPTLIGFTPGGNAVDPGNRDLTASFPFSTDSIDQAALGLTGSTNPVLNSTVNLVTTNPTVPGIGICFVTLADLPPFSPVGLDLGLIGAPGCVANVDINQGVGNVISNLGLPGLSMTVPFPIPAGPPTIIGQSFFCQSVWLDAAQNAGGLITSNALRLKVGAF